jgi:hypothetical protein
MIGVPQKFLNFFGREHFLRKILSAAAISANIALPE